MILVDAANVVGSKPNGWWKDRPGAARKLVERIQRAAAAGDLARPVVIVLEGAARQGFDEGSYDDVRVVHAKGEGDDTLADVAAAADEPVTLVSADRGLRDRVTQVGAQSVGPSWLYDRLPD